MEDLSEIALGFTKTHFSISKIFYQIQYESKMRQTFLLGIKRTISEPIRKISLVRKKSG